MKNKSQLVLLVLQATPFCNLDCKYCYLPDRLNKNSFDLSLIPKIMRGLIDEKLLTDSLNINWHAGEPTVLPTEFYEEAFNLFEEHNNIGVKIKHFFQTNATLLTPEYCEFIKKNNISVGVSIDGPKFINDRNRVYRNNKGSFNKMMQGIELLRSFNIDFSVISVLTDYSLNFPEEIFLSLKSLNPRSIGFNVEEKEGCNMTTSIDRTMKNKYYDFLSTFNELLFRDEKPIHQREYVRTLNSIIYQSENYKNGLVTPLSTISIAANGDFTVFSPELLTIKDNKYGNYVFGNVKNDSFKSIYKNEKFIKIYDEIQKGVDQCRRECEFFDICGGGSPSNKLHENGTFNSMETNYCLYNIKIPAELVLQNLNQ